MNTVADKIIAREFVITSELTPPKGIDLADVFAKNKVFGTITSDDANHIGIIAFRGTRTVPEWFDDIVLSAPVLRAFDGIAPASLVAPNVHFVLHASFELPSFRLLWINLRACLARMLHLGLHAVGYRLRGVFCFRACLKALFKPFRTRSSGFSRRLRLSLRGYFCSGRCSYLEPVKTVVLRDLRNDSALRCGCQDLALAILE